MRQCEAASIMAMAIVCVVTKRTPSSALTETRGSNNILSAVGRVTPFDERRCGLC